MRIAWFDAIGTPPNPQGEGPVIVNAFCNFHRQLEYPGEAIARHDIANPGRSSLETYVTLERSDVPGVVDASGAAKLVWTNFTQQKSVPLPDGLRALAR